MIFAVLNGIFKRSLEYRIPKLQCTTTIFQDDLGTVFWLLDGNLHRENGPAAITFNGSRYWYRHGELHREDGPAIIHPDREKKWFVNDILHRDGGPAIIGADGFECWYKNGLISRDDAPAVFYPDGTFAWYKNGILLTEEQVSTRVVNDRRKTKNFANLSRAGTKDKALFM